MTSFDIDTVPSLVILCKHTLTAAKVLGMLICNPQTKLAYRLLPVGCSS